ncbi:MAG: hypothetical protein P4L91_18495 [Burkholderiaceae bacterium]|nr:hypothetical protein [Burkholderiaceae bacterium]
MILAKKIAHRYKEKGRQKIGWMIARPSQMLRNEDRPNHCRAEEGAGYSRAKSADLRAKEHRREEYEPDERIDPLPAQVLHRECNKGKKQGDPGPGIHFRPFMKKGATRVTFFPDRFIWLWSILFFKVAASILVNSQSAQGRAGKDARRTDWMSSICDNNQMLQLALVSLTSSISNKDRKSG